jgi:hypothetical protein
MLNRAGFGGLQDILGAGREALRQLRSPTLARAAEEVQPPNTPPGSPDGIKQHSPSAKPAPDVPQYDSGVNPSVYQKICEEWRKISDPNTGFEYFTSKFCFINNQNHGYVNFKLYDYQKRTAKMLQENRFVITKKFRQAGMSLLTGVYCLWYSLVNPRMQCLILSIGMRESTKYLNENIREVYESLPQWLKGGLNEKGLPIKWTKKKSFKDSATEFWLPNKSKIRSLPSGKAGGRGFSTKLLIIDEAAFIEGIDNLWTGIFPTIVNTNGSVFVVSTVNGVGGTGGWYYHKYQEAMAGENDFKVAEMDYTEHPDYCDPEWAASVLRQLGQRKWDQEVIGKFLASGNTYISSEHIEKMEHIADELKLTIQPRMEHGGKLQIWKDFVGPKLAADGTTLPAHRYAIGADCATAGGLDYSSFHVIDVTAGEQVAEFKGKLPEDQYAAILANTGYRYGTAMIAVEVNATAGGATLVSLDKIQKYKRIYSDPNTGKLGWTTTSKSRNTMIANLESGLYDDSWIIRSHRLIDELKTFIVTKTGRIEADSNSHDDLTMAWCISTADEVVRAAQRATPRQPESVLLVREQNGEEENIVSKPVYSEAHDKEQARKKREDLLVGTKHGDFIEKMHEMNEVAGEDILGWLLK